MEPDFLSSACALMCSKARQAWLAEPADQTLIVTSGHQRLLLRKTGLIRTSGPFVAQAFGPGGPAQCHRNAGVCRTCEADSDLSAPVREVRAEMGPGASRGQVAL